MDIKEQIEKIVDKVKNDDSFRDDFMKNPEKNAVAKLGYAVTMIVVTSAIFICMKKYKDK